MRVVGERNHVGITLSFLVVTFFALTSSQYFGQESCVTRPHHLWVEPDADVTIGAVLPIHGSGEGVYGCGQPSPDGVQVFEAMRWAMDVLNRRSGLISEEGGTGEGSLIPGVKMGKCLEHTQKKNAQNIK